MRNLEWLPLANPPYSDYKFDIWLDDDFLFYLRKNKGLDEELKGYRLWSIPLDKQTIFESVCDKLNIKIMKYDYQDYIKEFEKMNEIYKPTKQDEIPVKDCVELCSDSFPEILCGPGTTQVLLEHTVAKKDTIKLYINSNEITGHNIPHCHVEYNSYRNYCVLSLVDFTKLAPDGDKKNAVICKAQSILQNNIQSARQKWNECHSLLKFKVVDGQYTSEYEKN